MEITVLVLIGAIVFVFIVFNLDDSPLDDIRHILAFCVSGLAVLGLYQIDSEFLGTILLPSVALALTLLTLPFVMLIGWILKRIVGFLIRVVIHFEMNDTEKQVIADSGSVKKRNRSLIKR